MSDASAPSVAARDDLAGVVDLFDWLTRAELSLALSELAFKQRTEIDEDAIAAAIDVAVAEYALVPAPPAALTAEKLPPEGVSDPDDGVQTDTVALAVGPAAFPSLPADAEDLPHILDVPERGVDRAVLSEAVLARLAGDAVAAISEDNTERLQRLADVTYDIETWAPVDAGEIRERIVDELDSE